MLRTRMAKVLLVPAMMIPVSAATLAFATASSAATPAKAGVVKCTGLSGTALATGTLTGCNDPANTGGSGTFPTSPASSATITWASGGSTTGTVSYTGATTNTCASGSSEETVTGKVTSDTGAGSSVAVGGKIKGDICISGTGALSLAPGTKFKI